MGPGDALNTSGRKHPLRLAARISTTRSPGPFFSAMGGVMGLVLLGCVLAGLLIYFVLVRPFVVPLTRRIPTGRQYRATLTGSRRPGGAIACQR